eukprot:jgi/Antlo1/1694/810
MSNDEKFNLIARNLQEILEEGKLKAILQKRNLRIYWGTATTGKPHIAYFLPIMKIRDFVLAECEVKVLLADIHAFLDNLKAPVDLISLRTEYYEKVIRAMLVSLDVDISKVKFVRGSSYQRSEKYVMDLYRLSTLTSERDAKKAGSQVVKQVESPVLSSLVYPCMQALDEEYLGVDAQFGGVDQRKIFTYAMKYLPMLGYDKRIHLMNPMIGGLNSEKMSSSDIFSKIELHEKTDSIRKKVRKCYCSEGDTTTGLFQLIKFVVFPVCSIRKLKIEVLCQDGLAREYKSYEDLERDFCSRLVHPGDLKNCVVEILEEIIRPVREAMEDDIVLINKAYAS